MYTRHPRKAIDHEIDCGTGEDGLEQAGQDVYGETLTAKIMSIKEHIHDLARKNILKAQQHQKHYYDAKYECHHVSCFFCSLLCRVGITYNIYKLIYITAKLLPKEVHYSMHVKLDH